MLPDCVLQVVLGIWGNSDSNNIKHWLPLVATAWPPSTDLQWDEATSTCRNVAKGLQVRLKFHSRQQQQSATASTKCHKHQMLSQFISETVAGSLYHGPCR